MLFQLRDIQTIRQGYSLAPVESDLRRLCAAHLENIMHNADVTDWIDHEPDPFLRELYATCTFHLIEEYIRDGELRNDYNVWEPIWDELRRIARCAFGAQMGHKMYVAEKLATTEPPQEAVVQTMPILQDLTNDMAYFKQELRELKDYVYHKAQTATPHWPYFTEKATEEDKQTFDNFLYKLCSSNKKGISGDIKLYLEQKEKMGIIKRPQLLSVEIDILRTFGLTVPEKTYYNA